MRATAIERISSVCVSRVKNHWCTILFLCTFRLQPFCWINTQQPYQYKFEHRITENGMDGMGPNGITDWFDNHCGFKCPPYWKSGSEIMRHEKNSRTSATIWVVIFETTEKSNCQPFKQTLLKVAIKNEYGNVHVWNGAFSPLMVLFSSVAQLVAITKAERFTNPQKVFSEWESTSATFYTRHWCALRRDIHGLPPFGRLSKCYTIQWAQLFKPPSSKEVVRFKSFRAAGLTVRITWRV